VRIWLWLLDPNLAFNDAVCRLEQGGGVLSLPRRYVLELPFQFLSKTGKGAALASQAVLCVSCSHAFPSVIRRCDT